VAVIVASGGDPSPQIAKAATQTIPIVFGTFTPPALLSWRHNGKTPRGAEKPVAIAPSGGAVWPASIAAPTTEMTARTIADEVIE